jgi:hypothetical protein
LIEWCFHGISWDFNKKNGDFLGFFMGLNDDQNDDQNGEVHGI